MCRSPDPLYETNEDDHFQPKIVEDCNDVINMPKETKRNYESITRTVDNCILPPDPVSEPDNEELGPTANPDQDHPAPPRDPGGSLPVHSLPVTTCPSTLVLASQAYSLQESEENLKFSETLMPILEPGSPPNQMQTSQNPNPFVKMSPPPPSPQLSHLDVQPISIVFDSGNPSIDKNPKTKYAPPEPSEDLATRSLQTFTRNVSPAAAPSSKLYQAVLKEEPVQQAEEDDEVVIVDPLEYMSNNLQRKLDDSAR